MNLSPKVTVLIPTYNRYAFLKRLLRYYLNAEITFDILIADSSTDHLSDDELTRLIDSPRVSYLKFPSETNLFEKIRQALGKITTEYVVICADDDFIIPSAIQECIDFMEQNTGYAVVQGLRGAHLLRKRGNGEVEFDWTLAPTGSYKSITFDDPSERLKYHLSNYTVTIYGVHRTSTLRLIFKETVEAISHGRLGEVVSSALTLIYGKMATLPIFYGSREHSSSSVDKTFKIRPYFHTTWSSFLKSDNCKVECERAVECLAKNLQKQTGLDTDMAMKIAEDALNGYLEPLRLRLLKQQSRLHTLSYLLKVIALDKLHLRSLMFDSYINNRRLRAAQREYSDFLGKNDLKFQENFKQIREAVIESKVYFIS